MKLLTVAKAFALVTTIASCRDSTTLRDGAVNVRVEGQAVHLYNLSYWPVAYAAFDVEILPLIEWIKCASPNPECLRLPARESVLVPFSQIFGAKGSGNVAVFAWRVVPKGGGGYQTVDVSVIGPR